MSLLFLGGTCANNKWRKPFIDKLVEAGVDAADVFDPVVDDWNEDAQRKEELAKAHANLMLFYLASPKQEGNPLSSYSMVEATMSLYDRPLTTVVIFDNSGIEGQYLKAFKQTKNVLSARFPKANIFDNLDEAVTWLSDHLKTPTQKQKKD